MTEIKSMKKILGISLILLAGIGGAFGGYLQLVLLKSEPIFWIYWIIYWGFLALNYATIDFVKRIEHG